MQDIRDVIAIESTHQYWYLLFLGGEFLHGWYGPHLLDSFQEWMYNPKSDFAAAAEVDTTNFYIYKHIQEKVKNYNNSSWSWNRRRLEYIRGNTRTLTPCKDRFELLTLTTHNDGFILFF